MTGIGRRSLLNDVDVFGNGQTRVVGIHDVSGRSKDKTFIGQWMVERCKESAYGPPIMINLDGANRFSFVYIAEQLYHEYELLAPDDRQCPTWVGWCIGHNGSLLQKTLCKKIAVFRKAISETRFVVRFFVSHGMVLHWFRGSFAKTKSKVLQFVLWCATRFGTTHSTMERVMELKQNMKHTVLHGAGGSTIVFVFFLSSCVLCFVLTFVFCVHNLPLYVCLQGNRSRLSKMIGTLISIKRRWRSA